MWFELGQSHSCRQQRVTSAAAGGRQDLLVHVILQIAEEQFLRMMITCKDEIGEMPSSEMSTPALRPGARAVNVSHAGRSIAAGNAAVHSACLGAIPAPAVGELHLMLC